MYPTLPGYYPSKGQKAAEAARHICNVNGKGVIGERAAQKLFEKFKNRNLDLEITPRSGRSSEFDEEHIKTLLKEDGRQTTQLEWEVLQHPPYSPDLAPTDYHLFSSMSNHMRGTTFDDEEDLKTWLNNFFDTRPGDFWRNGINKLVERWEEVSVYRTHPVALILTCKTSKEIWKALHARYEGDKRKIIIEARNDVSRLVMKREEKWEDYLYRAERLLEQARNLGADIEDEEFITSAIRGLPHKYNLIVLQLSNQEKLTIFDLRNSLKLYHERFSNDTKEENSSAFKVYSKDKYKHCKEMKTPKTYKCFICHKPGHKAAECWHNPENKKNTNVKQTFASQGSSGYKANTPNKNSKATFAKDENRNDFAKLVKQQDNLEQQWILDSGASSHDFSP
ncbi:hypothetical protein LAZ67_11002025 [Cordylochernes scorpioides]|uniref:CCHC-type domain-containing protein n=1 Tax=Cordylochernes scorpioides TaxID=51811 RepID=A0ABY6KYV2_9ARAC|nr:hypothetical protein LAZ67_11002025 [Cordylochernes scorpioides]